MALIKFALTTVEALKTYLRIEDDSQTTKDELERFINATSDEIQKYCGRSFGESSYTEVVSGTGKNLITLKQFPITSVVTVEIDGIGYEDYEILPEEGMLYRRSRWPLGERNIFVAYTAGYVLPKDETSEKHRTLPYDLEEACIYWAAYKYKERESIGVESERLGDYSVQYSKLAVGTKTLEAPAPVLAILNRYVGRWV